MTVTPHFYQYVRWPLFLKRCASVEVELLGAIRIKRLNTSLFVCDVPLLVFLLSYRYRYSDVYKQSSHTHTHRNEEQLLFVVLNDTN